MLHPPAQSATARGAREWARAMRDRRYVADPRQAQRGCRHRLRQAVERAGACEALTTASDGPLAGWGGGATSRGERGAACAKADEATERGGRRQTRAVCGACCGVVFRRLRVATAWVESEVTRRATEPAA